MHHKSIYQRLLIDKAPTILAFLIALSAVGFFLGSRVQLKLSLTDLLPDNHPAVVKFNKITEVIGGVGYLAIVLEADDKKSHLEIAPKLAEALSQSHLVKSVFYHREQRYFVDRLLYYMSVKELEDLDKNIKKQIKSVRRKMFDLGLFDEEEKPEAKNEVFSGEVRDLAKKSAGISPYLTSKDTRHLLVMVKPSFDSMDMASTQNLVVFARKVVEETLNSKVKYEFGERYYNKIIETDIIQSDIFILGGTSIALILIILLLYLKSFKALVVIFAPVFLGMGITMGLAYLFIGHINIVTGFLMGIISGLGVDYGIHLVLRLDLEKREKSSDHPDPVWRTLQSSGHSVFVGAIAASVAFFFLGFSSFRAFSEFGIICGIGILAVFASLMGSFSPLTRLMGLHTSKQLNLTKFGFSIPVIPVPKGLIVCSILTFALMVFGLRVTFEYDFDKMMRHSKKMEEVSKLIDVIYDRWSAPSALASETKEEAIEVEKVLKDHYSKDLVSELVSGATIVPEQQHEKQAVLQRIDRTLAKISNRSIEQALDVPGKTVRDWLKAKPFELQEIPSHVQDALRGTRHSGYLLYVYPKIKLSTLQGVKKWSAMIRDLENRFPNLLTGSDAVVFSDILDLINRDGIAILIVIFITVGLFIWINVRKTDETLLSYLPLLLALPTGMGLMALFDIQFNIFNIAIIPSFVAMGIDVPIHIVHRAKEVGSGFKAARDLSASINLALSTAGVGFGILIFARAGVLKSLGWIALLGTIGIWWIGMFMLPSFLEWFLNRKKNS